MRGLVKDEACRTQTAADMTLEESLSPINTSVLVTTYGVQQKRKTKIIVSQTLASLDSIVAKNKMKIIQFVLLKLLIECVQTK
jgi:hypothetical protein